MNRQEHLEWCKQRARQYLDRGDLEGAVCSMETDLKQHADTKDHPAPNIALLFRLTGRLSTVADVRKFIDDCN